LYILIVYVFRQQTRGQNVLDWMVANITQIQSPLNFFLKKFDLLLLFPSIWTVWHFRGSVSYLYVMILTY
jgi:hypothetical protein